MRKSVTTPVMLGLLTVLSFSSLFVLHTLTEPIIINRENQQLLTILDTPTFAGVTIEATQQAPSPYTEAGVERYQRFLRNNDIFGIIYTIETTGYNSGLKLTVGIREGAMRTLIVDATNETPSFGGVYLDLLPDLVKDVPIADEATFIATLSVQTTGMTTRNVVIQSLLAAIRHYQSEVVA